MAKFPNVIGVKNGVTKKIEMPEDIKQEVFAVMETAEKIKGEDFTDFVKFIMNMTGLLSMFMENFRPEDRILERPNSAKVIRQLHEMISNVSSTLTSMYADAKGLSEEDINEALKTASTMNNIVDEFARRVNKSDE
jgi:hypothetical protein